MPRCLHIKIRKNNSIQRQYIAYVYVSPTHTSNRDLKSERSKRLSRQTFIDRQCKCRRPMLSGCAWILGDDVARVGCGGRSCCVDWTVSKCRAFAWWFGPLVTTVSVFPAVFTTRLLLSTITITIIIAVVIIIVYCVYEFASK